MNIEEKIENAQRKFIEGCWDKFRKFYIPHIENKNIIIYGNGVYGRFLFDAFDYIGFKKNIKYIINDYISKSETYNGVPVVRYEDITISDENDIIVIGIQNSSVLISKIQNDRHRLISADAAQSFFQDNLMGLVYKCINISSISDVYSRIRYYYEEMINKREYILSLYNEKLSKEIIRNRLDFYETGDCKFIDMTPVTEMEYFSEDYYEISQDEVYVDCGAYDGDSILSFINYVDCKYEKIFGFEPDRISYERLKTNTNEYQNIVLFPYATGNEDGEVLFESTGNLGSSMLSGGNDKVEIKKLDNILNYERVTLIKIDVEGAELDTLKGLTNVIKGQKPKLAVCIYHMMDDLIDIPEFINSLNPDYKFIVRQHVDSILDTVLYAE